MYSSTTGALFSLITIIFHRLQRKPFQEPVLTEELIHETVSFVLPLFVLRVWTHFLTFKQLPLSHLFYQFTFETFVNLYQGEDDHGYQAKHEENPPVSSSHFGRRLLPVRFPRFKELLKESITLVSLLDLW